MLDLDDVPDKIRQLFVELNLLLILPYLLSEGFQLEIGPLQLVLQRVPRHGGENRSTTRTNNQGKKMKYSGLGLSAQP